jgi:hypothetical protein
VALVGSAGGYWLAHKDDGPGVVQVSPTNAAPSGTATKPAPSSASPAAGTTGKGFSAAAQVDPADAAAQLKRAGIATQGTPREAWGWTDANGRNLFVTTKTVTKTEGSVERAGLLHVSGYTLLAPGPRAAGLAALALRLRRGVKPTPDAPAPRL